MANFDHPIDFVHNRIMNFEGYDVPYHTQGALSRYYLCGFDPGGFLSTLIKNANLPNDHWYWDSDPQLDEFGHYDYEGICGLADYANRPKIREIHKWVIEQLPPDTWGSEQNFRSYIKSMLT